MHIAAGGGAGDGGWVAGSGKFGDEFRGIGGRIGGGGAGGFGIGGGGEWGFGGEWGEEESACGGGVCDGSVGSGEDMVWEGVGVGVVQLVAVLAAGEAVGAADFGGGCES